MKFFRKNKETVPEKTFNSLTKLPTNEPGTFNWEDLTLDYQCPNCLHHLIKEILEREIYYFKSETEFPYIIDCGANIGVSPIYFSRLYPNAKIIAFEPDPFITKFTKQNLIQAGAKNVQLIESALSDQEGEITFHSDQELGGSIHEEKPHLDSFKVRSQKLSPYLDKPVDLLKIDIEGAENLVIQEILPKLSNVKNIFVECHSFVNQKQNCLEIPHLLVEAGFRVYLEGGGIKNKKPFSHAKTYRNQDLQFNVWATRT